MENSELSGIGRLAPSDLGDAEALVAEAGWNQVGADWRTFLDFGTVYAVRANGRVVATAATLPYGRCAWISMVLVAGSHRRRGLATRLLNHCIADIQAAGLVPALDATPAGRTVYAPLGFQEAWGFARLVSRQYSAHSRESGNPVLCQGLGPRFRGDERKVAIQPITDSAWPALCAYDAAVFGADRSQILARLRGRLPPANLFAERGGRITGLLLGRDGRTAAHLGPLIADDDAVAMALLERALSEIRGTVYIDLADAKSDVRARLEASGFAPQRPFTRMLLGQNQSFDDLARSYAVIGPEFG